MKRICSVAALVGVLAVSACSEFVYPERRAFYAETYTLSPEQVKIAALEGDGDAQYALGYMYFYGYGVKPNRCEAKYWLDQAGKKGHQEAMQAMDLLSKIERQREQCAQAKHEYYRCMHPCPPKPDCRYNVDGGVSFHRAPARVRDTGNGRYNISVSDMNAKHATMVAVPMKSPVVYQDGGYAPLSERQVYSYGERYLLTKPRDHFTLQLATSHNVNHLREIIQSNKIGMNSAIYRTTHFGKPIFVLVYGDYATRRQAKAAVSNLPRDVRALKPVVEGMPYVKAKIFAAAHQHPVKHSVQPQVADKMKKMRAENELNMKVRAEVEKENNAPQVSTVKMHNAINEIHEIHEIHHTPVQSHLTLGERYLMAKPDNHYTLELSSSAKIGDLRKIIQTNKIGLNTAVYRQKHQGNAEFVLVYGDYKSHQEATASIQRLPANVRKLIPRVTSMSSIKDTIKNHGVDS